MVAATSEPQAQTTPTGADVKQERIGESFKEALRSVHRLAGIQGRLLALYTKLTIERIVIFMILAAAAAGIGILGLIFLDIGLYHLFTMVMAPHWAYLVHAALHLIIATALFIYARNQFNKPNAFIQTKHSQDTEKKADYGAPSADNRT